MVRAKNYESVSKFVKVMTKILWPLFFRTRCSCSSSTYSWSTMWRNCQSHKDVSDSSAFSQTYCSRNTAIPWTLSLAYCVTLWAFFTMLWRKVRFLWSLECDDRKVRAGETLRGEARSTAAATIRAIVVKIISRFSPVLHGCLAERIDFIGYI